MGTEWFPGWHFGSTAAGGAGTNKYVQRFPKNIRLAAANPEITLRVLDKLDAEDSLIHFVKVMWHCLEPGRQFVHGRAIEAICEHLEAVSNGEIRKLLINVPPGCMKSLSTDVFYPAWEWGPRNHPHLRFISASYSKDLTLRDNRRCRQLIADPLYQEYWGDRFTIASDQDAKGRFENDKRGWKFATSVGGQVVGERGDVFIIDDPHNIKNAESTAIREATLQWFSEVVPSRVNDPDNATFIIIMQRVHERDVSGLILEKELGYEHLCLPMEYESDHPHPGRSSIGFVDWRTVDGQLLWPERYPMRAVVELKEQLRSWGGEYAEVGQLQQRPTPRGGGAFKKSHWQFFATEYTAFGAAHRPAGCTNALAVSLPPDFDFTYASVDAAFKDGAKGSRVSIQVISQKGPFTYVRHVVTKHMTFKETCDHIAEFGTNGSSNAIIGGVLHEYPEISKVLIEDKANGPAIINTLRQKLTSIIGLNPEGGKESRASAMQPRIESGHIMLPDGAPWLEDYIAEFASFPVGAHDDQVDALSQYIIYITDDNDAMRALAMSRL